MSNEAPAWFQEQWNSRVTLVYQQKGYLTRGMSTGPTRVDGKKMHFPIAGKGVAQSYARGDAVKPMNATRGEILLDAEEWDAGDYVYQYDIDRMLPNELDVVRDTAAMALGRKHDEVLYDKVKALKSALVSAGQVVNDYTDLPGPGDILAARRILFNADVPVEDGANFCGLPPVVFDNMMSFEVFANSQWVGPNLPFADGLRRRSWQNIHFFELPVHLQQNLTGTEGDFFMWHRSSLGTGHTGAPVRSDFEKEVKYKRWWWHSTISGGATVIQQAGIVLVKYKTDALPTFT